MKFHKSFDRLLADLNTDTLANQTLTKDNVVAHRGQSNSGSPIACVSAIWLPSVDEGVTALPLRLAMIDSERNRWFWTSAAITVVQNQMVTFPVIVPAEGAIDPARLQSIGGGGIEVALIPGTVGGLLSPTHTFSMAFNLSAG